MALLQEFRLAARVLAKNKGWTAVALLALALGLGANIAMFSVVGLMVWIPMPYPQPEQLVYITQSNAQKGFGQAGVSLEDNRDWASASTIAAIASYESRPMAVSGQGEPQYLPAMQVTPEFFAVMGVRPALGRAFTAAETPETESRVAIISHELWQGTYRGEPGVLGREIRLEGRNYSIIGVMPEGFHYLFEPTDVWIPLSLEAGRRERAARGLNNVARLKPGVTIDQAAAEVRSISERIEQEDPAAGLGWRGRVRPLTDRIIGSGARAAAGSMFGAVGFVLLIACANVASLLLARGAGRRRELALRASLGASRSALIRLQLAESLLLSVAGGVIGVISAVWTIPLFKRIAPSEMAIFKTASLDWSALGYGLALSLATGIVFGVAPAWLLTRGDLAPALRESSRGATGGRHLVLKSLVAGEMALALVLVAASTLMIRSLIRQSRLDVGFDRTNLAAARVLLSSARYPGRTQVLDFYSRLLENLRRDGGVAAAALTQALPLSGYNSYNDVTIEGDSEARRDNLAGDMIVSPGYFHAMGIPLLAGRDFSDADHFDAPKVAIVNETFLKWYWPKAASPVGRRIRMRGQTTDWITVVGLARDVRHRNPYDPPRPEVYRPHRQVPFRSMTVVARGRGGAQTAAGALRTAIFEVDREQPLFRLESVEALLARRSQGERATTDALGIMAVLALILAAVGTYGVMSYTAAQRVREIGIRLALGAGRRDVFRMMLGGGLALAAIGLIIGLPAAYGVTPLLRAVAEGLDAKDGAAYGGVALMLFAVALAACVVPAWRAMRVDPATVLRDE
jgi:putative ABC transport system permease protein